MTRYVVVGAGAVGGTIGARLAEAGRDVVLVARGAHGEAMRANGLTLATPDGTVHVRPPVVTAVCDLDLSTEDVVILTTKTQDTAAALADLAAFDRDVPIACAQNGVANERFALRWFPRVYGVCTWLPATHLRPGAVAAEGTPYSGMLDVGRYPSGVDDTAREIAADLAASHFVGEARDNVMPRKYGKLLTNLGNALDAGCAPGPDRDELGDRAIAEGRAVLAAAGIDAVDEERDLVQIRPVDGQARQGGSTWQSLTRGTGSVETDYLNGEIALLGRLHGVPTPVNAALQRLGARMVREHLRPRSVPVAEIVTEIVP